MDKIVLTYSLKNAPDRSLIKKLYMEAFPKEERIPWLFLQVLPVLTGTRLTAYYDGELFCGFTYSAAFENTLLVLFLAVEVGLRGKGYGSKILEHLKQSDPNRTILLNVELLDPQADNYSQRLQRMAFYQKNGFYDTGYDIDEVGGTFRVLATTPEPDMDAYLRVFAHISFGFWKPPIRKITEKKV